VAKLQLKQALEQQAVQQKEAQAAVMDPDRAAQLFVEAVSEVPDGFRTDREVYEWLVANPPKDGDYGVHIGPYVEDELPPYENWLRGLQAARTEALRYHLPLLCRELAQAALEAGELATAKRHAQEWLADNAEKDFGLHGRIVYDMNEILGRVALREGDVTAAKGFLINAGDVAGAASLDTFGPSMNLARELLLEGERDAVIEYLDLLWKCWGQENGARRAAEPKQLLQQWKADIQAGEIPEDAIWQGRGY
jgi:hypothetical protein